MPRELQNDKLVSISELASLAATILTKYSAAEIRKYAAAHPSLVVTVKTVIGNLQHSLQQEERHSLQDYGVVTKPDKLERYFHGDSKEKSRECCCSIS